ncbi:ZIP family metal transporter [Psychroflexus salis]|uniref:ZIP Zinc transporter n=1 Tax=Psychroflexus salis TaxID=1526574 RepID=A0A916ZTA3_9FLAO|nr:ZIP family metal transporter [Psychroflexus salis]GGE10497.1 hypothetical protein GCM10010831_10010 [Psychroflexus salis]
MNILLPILAVFAGFGIAYFIKYQANTINLLLAFSGSFLLSITVLEFIPHVYRNTEISVGIFIMAGIILQLVLEFLSGGAEHGHLHQEKMENHFPWVLFISLCVHALFEGFPISHTSSLLLAVVVHKIPVAIIISSFLFKANLSTFKITGFLVLFGLMTPLGSYIGEYTDFLKDYAVYIDAIVIGIFLHISTTILFESSKNHRFNASKFIVILIGIAVAYFLGHGH